MVILHDEECVSTPRELLAGRISTCSRGLRSLNSSLTDPTFMRPAQGASRGTTRVQQHPAREEPRKPGCRFKRTLRGHHTSMRCPRIDDTVLGLSAEPPNPISSASTTSACKPPTATPLKVSSAASMPPASTAATWPQAATCTLAASTRPCARPSLPPSWAGRFTAPTQRSAAPTPDRLAEAADGKGVSGLSH